MPRGHKGGKRPAGVVGNAVKVMRLATGEETEVLTDDGKNAAAVALGPYGVRRGLLEGRRRSGRRSPRKPRIPMGKNSKYVHFCSI